MNEYNFSGFSKLNYTGRLQKLVADEVLTEEEAQYLKSGGLHSIDLSENFIENSLGYFQLPIGVATHFKIDSQDYIIPMAVEETSIIAAASKTAKWIRENGEITTEMRGTEIIGQIQFSTVADFKNFSEIIEKNKDYLIRIVNQDVTASLVQRGGGVTNIKIRQLSREDGKTMAVLHVYMNPCEAMGANMINQACEYLKPLIENLTSEKVTMCILSNLVDSKLTYCKIVIKNIEPDLAYKIQEASYFAELDSYRAATNNKGVMNGVDPVLIATGNDWRAVEAGMHAFAASSGSYKSITKWRVKDNHLVGELLAPIIVGTVGGMTTLHPTARLCMRMMNIKSSEQLSRVIAAVGLTQNLGALKALTTVGIIEGHMKLHVRNLSLGAGATESEMPFLVKRLEEVLKLKKRISQSVAVEVLNELRKTTDIRTKINS